MDFTQIAIIGLLLICSGVLTFWQFKRKTKEEQDTLIADTISKLNGMILSLMYQARENFKDGEGIFKKSDVIKGILNSPFYVALPVFAKLFLSAEAIGAIIDKIYDELFKNKK